MHEFRFTVIGGVILGDALLFRLDASKSVHSWVCSQNLACWCGKVDRASQSIKRTPTPDTACVKRAMECQVDGATTRRLAAPDGPDKENHTYHAKDNKGLN